MKQWWARLSLKFLVWMSFDIVDLESLGNLEGYFWVQVARCISCGNSVNVPAITPLEREDFQGALEHHTILCGDGKYPRNQKLAGMQMNETKRLPYNFKVVPQGTEFTTHVPGPSPWVDDEPREEIQDEEDN